MKHSFTYARGHSLEIRQSNSSTKLFLSIDDKPFKRIDDQPLKPAIVTALLQEIINLKQTVDSLSKECIKLEEDKEYNASLVGSLTGPEVISLLNNIGYNTECGACMEISYTGVTTSEHDCTSEPQRVEVDLDMVKVL